MKPVQNLLSIILVATFIAVFYTSCASPKKYNDMVSQKEACTKKNTQLEKDIHDANVKLTECNSISDRLKSQLEAANNELDQTKRDYQRGVEELKELQANYDEMNAKYTASLSGKNSENKKLVQELQTTREFLNKKEQELQEKDKELQEKAKILAEKEKRVNELQAILDKKDKDLQSLKDKVNDALLGFQDKGLTIHTKNGKVYVSMDEKLLFASGSWVVGGEGRNAIREVGFILQKNPDIQILIEGHTDNVPLNAKSGDIKDNWDLSVMRATSIVKILLENKGINPKNVCASGRGEYDPLVTNDTKENRAKNRRTSLILSPKLDELFEILNN